MRTETITLSEAQAVGLIELINRVPNISGAEVEVVCALKKLITDPFSAPPPDMEAEVPVADAVEEEVLA